MAESELSEIPNDLVAVQRFESFAGTVRLKELDLKQHEQFSPVDYDTKPRFQTCKLIISQFILIVQLERLISKNEVRSNEMLVPFPVNSFATLGWKIE